MRYFAYGSNMDPVQMSKRCPGARALGAALLPNYRLTFVWDSPGWGGGVGHVEPDPSGDVHGVLWDLDAEHETALDAYEGVDAGVYRKAVVVVRAADGPTEALVYLANDPRAKLPSARYVRALIRGAEAHGLPDEYVRRLRERLPARARA